MGLFDSLQDQIEELLPEGENDFQERYRFITDIDTNDIREEAGDEALELLEDLQRAFQKPTITSFRSEVDDAHLVFIDTDGIPDDGEHGPKIRIYLNNNAVYEDPVFPGLPVEEAE